jgi:hypothetical protein
VKSMTLILVMFFFFTAYFIFADDVKNAISEKEFFQVFSGTWINEDYNGSTYEPQKFVHYSDGKWERYLFLNDDISKCYGTNTIIDTWTDSNGDYWCTANMECTKHNVKSYTMRKISDSGNTHEMLLNYVEPIEEWNPDDTYTLYMIHYRQE